MTEPRRYGDDSDFGREMRQRKDLDSVQHWYTANDADWIILRYQTPVDKKGERTIQCMMILEVKTLSGVSRYNQLEALFFEHQCSASKRTRKRTSGVDVSVWHYGVRFLRFSGTRCGNSSSIQWGSFGVGPDKKPTPNVLWTSISGDMVWDLLKFDLDPNTLQPTSFRRHHSTKQIIVDEKLDNGIVAARIVTRSS